MPKIPSRIPFWNISPTTTCKITTPIGLLALKYLGNYLNKNSITDFTYGIRRKGNQFFIGNKEIVITFDDITIYDQIYKVTNELLRATNFKRTVKFGTIWFTNL